MEKLLWTLFNINQPIPLDKICVFILILTYYPKIETINKTKIIVAYFLLFSLISVSFLINSNRNFLIFYPLIFSLSAAIISNTRINLKLIQDSLLLNIYIGLILSILATLLNTELPGTLSLIEKKLPFFYAPMGFCPTLQVYGTICIAWIIIAFETNQKKTINFYVILLSSIITLNRATLLFLLIVFFIYKTKLTTITVLIIAAILLSQDFIREILFSSSTLSSRSELRVGAELSYWNSKDFIIHLVGKGSHITTEEIANKTLWGRTYIENGLDFIFHSYGIIGFIIYNLTIIFLIIKAIINKRAKFILLIIYYYYIEQFLTNEYLTFSLTYISIITLVLIKKQEAIHEKSINSTPFL